MAKICKTPGEAGAPRWAAVRVGRIVEWVVKQDYCLSKSGCSEFELGGSGTDFFDENSSTTRCRFLASYLATHTPSLDESFISGSCEARKRPVDPDDEENERFAVPDIITHEPDVRMEFYEIKPDSESGRRAGRAKIETFLSLTDFLKQTNPEFAGYEMGTQFNPDRSIVFYRRNYLGIVPCEAALHYRRATEEGLTKGLIVYEICVQVDGELLEALAKAIIVSAVIAALILLAAAAAAVLGEILVPALLVFSSPMGGSVGPDGTNDTQDIRYAQALINDWRASTGGSLIAINGELGEETAGALSDFQANSGLEDTGGNMTPGDATETALERTHLDNLVAAADLGELQQPDGLGEFVFRADPDGIDPEMGDETDEQTAFNTTVQQYLQAVHDSV